MTSNLDPVQIYLFRHGETDWNRDRRFQGHTDIPLNDQGRIQAQALTEILQTLKLDVLFTSDLSRAKETADIANAVLKLPLYVDAGLRECRLGDPEGELRDSIIAKYGAPAWERWLSVSPDDHHYGFPNGETKHDHLLRLHLSIEAFLKSHPRFKRIGISTHGGSVRRLAHAAKGAPSEPIPLPNCALYELSYSPTAGEWNFIGAITSSSLDLNSADGNVWGKK